MSETLKRIAAHLRALPGQFAADHRKAADIGIPVWNEEKERTIRADPAEMLKQKEPPRRVPVNQPIPHPIPGVPPDQWPVVDFVIVEDPAFRAPELERCA